LTNISARRQRASRAREGRVRSRALRTPPLIHAHFQLRRAYFRRLSSDLGFLDRRNHLRSPRGSRARSHLAISGVFVCVQVSFPGGRPPGGPAAVRRRVVRAIQRARAVAGRALTGSGRRMSVQRFPLAVSRPLRNSSTVQCDRCDARHRQPPKFLQ
jgi:hypothetical protein